MASQHNAFKPYGWTVCFWILLVTFQYGYHIAALNQIQAALTCKASGGEGTAYSLPTCIQMSDATFSFVTSVFTIGGLGGSLVANVVMDRWGRKGAACASALLSALGAGVMGISGSVASFACGRLIVGAGAGLGVCVAPVYVAEITPERIRERVGLSTQLSIVTGVLIAQIIGFSCATATQWRLVLFASFSLAICQLLASTLMAESPVWLGRQGLQERRKASGRKLWGDRTPMSDHTARDVEDPLLQDARDGNPEVRTANVTVPQLINAPELRRPLLIVSLAMLAQQVSGINAVMYYSNEILSKALPKWGPYVSLSIAVVGFLATFTPIFLIDRFGGKSLLQLSTIGILASLLVVGIGLDYGFVIAASIAIIAFVTSFSVGLGPVPFAMIPEVSPVHAVSALSSVGLSMNWIVNFLVGLVFLPLRNFLSSGDPMKEGRVFYVFTALLSATAFMLFRVYRS